ncbi:aldo/keto reductase [Pseudoduganella ginsengisoli]|uniref:Aldo/keto reductase n=1 Tax=Pseudoduganella ginsengisoli TaxID=1462440 RepID=A0A6L6Q3S1_9BURK|nr:aldo/keto reductase [Pseudoduganella ginsengisoli]MTW03848.1 aldo/keto reductase [Pseudoduganella ginsengisoli]
MKPVQLSSGRAMPSLGLGTWNMGENDARRQQEIRALQSGLDLGMNLIDTAEMYGDGGAEEVVGEAIQGRRDSVYLVSKVYPHNATVRGVQLACERSLQRLKTDYLDCYLLHWRGSVPLAETLDGLQALKRAGKIRDYGVSNFDLDDMEQARSLPGGKDIVTNQVLFNLTRRGIEWNLLPWSQQHNVPVMAYSPLESSTPGEQRVLLGNRTLQAVAERHGATPAQIALAWLLRQDQVIVIPKSSNPEHVQLNRKAADIVLTAEDLADLDKGFPRPRKGTPLDMR